MFPKQSIHDGQAISLSNKATAEMINTNGQMLYIVSASHAFEKVVCLVFVALRPSAADQRPVEPVKSR